MKSKSHRLASLATLSITVALTAAPLAHAATLYWDGAADVTPGASDNITTTGQDWLSGGLWDDGTTSAALATWADGDNAVFGGSATSQTVTASALTVGNLTFGSGASGAGTSGTAYTISGGTITLSTSTVTTNTDAVIDSSLTGSSGLIKAGAGTLTLGGSAANTFSGIASVNSGILVLNKPDNVNAIGGNLGISGTGTNFVKWNANEQIPDTSSVSFSSGTLVLELLGHTETIAAISGGGIIENRHTETGINANGSLIVNQSTTTTYSGTIRDNGGGSGTGTLSIVKSGTGNLTLTTKNPFTGGITVNGGTLTSSASSPNTGFSTIGTGNVVINSGGTVITAKDNELGHTDSARMPKLVINGGTLTNNALNHMWTKSFDMTGGTINGSKGLDMRFTPTLTTFANPTTATIASSLVLTTDTTLDVADGAATADLTISGAISGAAKLTKNNAGTAALNGTNSYTGATTVSAGTLALGSGGTLSATDITVKNTATLQIGATGKTLKSLAVEGGSTLFLAAGAGTTTITNALTFTATPAFTVRPGFASAPAVGTYNLLTPGSISGTAGTITTDLAAIGATRVAGSTAVSGGKLVLTISSGADAQTWNNGAATGVWALNADLNFTGPNDGRFMTYDSVTFGDTAAGTVTLAGSLAPSAVTVASAFDYTFTGSGLITGTGSLTKSGAGTLTINTANTCSGATNLNGGIVSLGSPTALGIGGAITFGGGTLQYTAAGTTDYSARISSATGQAFNIDTNGQTVNFTTGLGGAGNTLAKSGAGSLTLTGTNTYTGGTTVNGGTLTFGAGAATGVIRGALTINSGATVNQTLGWSLGFSGGSDAVTGITINGGTLNFASAGLGGTSATDITMTGGTISGFAFDWYNGSAVTRTLTTLASSTTATVSSGIVIRLNSGGALKFEVADGAADVDLLVSGALGYQAGQPGAAVIKSGAGVMELSGANTYTGSTTINGGELRLSGAATLATSSITVAGGAVLDVSALASPFTLAAGKTLSAGRTSGFANDIKGDLVCSGNLHIAGTGNVAGTLTQSGDLTLDGASVKFDLGSTITPGGGVNDLVDVTGDLTLNNTTTVTINKLAGILAPGDYTLLRCNGTLTGDAANLSLTLPDTARQSYALSTAANSVVLSVTGIAANLVWNGADPTNPTFWDADTTANWTGGPNGKFADSDVVEFNDTATGTTVDLQTYLLPESVTFNNSTAKPYSIISTGDIGGIDGSTGITKNGNGIVTIASNNAYAGPTIIHAGTVSVADVTNNSAFGPLGAGNLIGLGDVSSTGTLQFTGPDDSTNRLVTLAAGGGILDVTTPGTTLTASGLISGDGGLTKTGAGTLALTGLSTYSGGTTVDSGTLRLTGGGDGHGAIRGTLTINSGATVSADGWALGYNSNYVDTISINGGTLDKTNGGGTDAHTINMTGGAITGAPFDFYNLLDAAKDIAFNTNASASTATVSAAMNLRMNNGGGVGGTMTFTVADGAAATDLLISGAITGASTQRIAKAGAGTMKLSGANTYGGATSVNAGKLVIDGTLGATAVTVASGGTLDAGSNISGMAALGSSVSIESGGHLAFHIAASPSGQVPRTITGALTLTSGNLVDLTAATAPADGTYTLATAATITGTAGTGTTLTLAPGRTATLSVSGGTSLVLTISSGGYDSWDDQITNGKTLRIQDADDDGLTNLQEFLFGTDPMASTGALNTTEKSGGNLIIRWKQRASGASYKLMESATLSNPWTEITTGLENDGPQVGDYIPRKATIAIGSGKDFFRVEGAEN